MVIRPCAGIDGPGEIAVCGCCGSRMSRRRVRIWLTVGGVPHGEICPACILSGPRGAAERLRERIREREEHRPGRRKGDPSGGWSGWMAGRALLLETMEGFPMGARQAAVREMRETR